MTGDETCALDGSGRSNLSHRVASGAISRYAHITRGVGGNISQALCRELYDKQSCVHII